MKKITTILLLLICTLSYGQSPAGLWASGYFDTVDTLVAADYYISGNGDDLNDGLSQSTPVRTLDGLSSYTLKPTDTIAIERGYQYTGSITIDTSAVGEILFIPYGVGSSPVVNNLVEVSGFTQNGNVYSKYLPGITEPRFSIFDGKPVKKGDWPNTRSIYFADSTKVDGFNNVIYSNANQTLPADLDGTEMVGHANQWANIVVPIWERLSSTSIRVDESLFSYKLGITVDDSVKFQNHPAFLEANGEWAFRNDTFYMYCSDDITNHTVEIPNGLNTFTISGNADVVLDNIDIKGTNQTVFEHSGTGNLTVNKSDIQFTTEIVGGDMTGDKLLLDSLNINDVFGRAFAASFSSNLDTIDFRNSTVNRAGLILGYDKYNYRGYNGAVMNTYVRDRVVAYNLRMDSLGYNGISSAPLNTNGTLEVSYCYGTYTNLDLIDGAFIHIGSQTNGLKWIHHNIAYKAGRNFYHDYGGNMYRWEDLTSIEPSRLYGLYMNDPKNTIVRRNLFYAASEAIRVQQWNDSTDLGYIHDLDMYNNTTFTEQYDYAVYQGLGNVTLPDVNFSTLAYGRQDSNWHVGTALGENKFKIRGGWGTAFDNTYTLTGIQTLGYETGSVEIQSTSPELKRNPSLDSLTLSFVGIEKTDQYGVVHTDSMKLGPFNSILFVDSIGVERIVNGGFDDASWWNNRDGDWTLSGNASINLGFYSPLISGDEVFVYASPNKTFTITFDVTVTSGTLQVGYCNSDGSTFGEINNYTSSQPVSIEYVHSNASLHYIVFYSQTGFNGSIDNVSVREKYY